MIFKRVFENERDAKQTALDQLGISIEDRSFNDRITVVATSPSGKTDLTPLTVNGWLESLNTASLYLWIQDKANLQIAATCIHVSYKTDTDKWMAQIELNPQASEYQNHISRLLHNEWTQFDEPWHWSQKVHPLANRQP